MRSIECEASAAAAQGKLPVDACPYPFRTPEALHWVACWILAGGILTPHGANL